MVPVRAAPAAIAVLVVAIAACAGTPSSASPPAGGVAAVPASVPAQPSATAAESAAVGSSDPVTRIALTGQSPAALAIDGDQMWVYEIESGDVSLADLAAGRETRTIHVGGLGSHIVLGGDGTIYLARFETDGSGEHLVVIEPGSDTVGGIATGPLGALTLGEDGSLLALKKADRLLQIDPASRSIARQVSVDVNDEHMEVQATAGAAWVASDNTPVRRISVPTLTVEATIDAGGGIPFVHRDGLLWGARPDAIWAIDPATDAVARTVPLDDVIEVLAMDIDGDDAWLAVRRPGHIGAVIRIDIADGRLVDEYPVSLPAAVRIAGDRAWVASYLTNELLGFAR